MEVSEEPHSHGSRAVPSSHTGPRMNLKDSASSKQTIDPADIALDNQPH